MAKVPKPNELVIDHALPKTGWMDTPVDFQAGHLQLSRQGEKPREYLGLPNPREWSPTDEDWKLPSNWKEIILEGIRERLDKYRSLKIFMDICVRCGACADKCHFYLGSGDPKNMPVLRAELLRSVYRKEFTLAGKIMGKMVGARELTEDVIKEWFMYFFQCTECRRCSLFCPYGIDTAEVHDDRPRTAKPYRLQHRLGRGPGGQLLPDRKPPWNPAARLQRHDRIFRRRNRRRKRTYRSNRPSTARGPRSCSSPLRATFSPTPAPTRSWAT